MDPININTYSDYELEIAKKCDDGDGFLNEEEYSIFNKAKEEFEQSSDKMQECEIKGVKYYYLSAIKKLIKLPEMIKFNIIEKTDAISNNKQYVQISAENIYEQYDEESGKKLANVAHKHKRGGSIHKCKKWVREDLERAGYGTITGNNGYEAMDSLRSKSDVKNTKNGCILKEVSNPNDVPLESIPDGSVVVYFPDNIRKDGEKNGYSRNNGHIAIVRTNPNTGEKEIIADGGEVLNKRPDAIFIPAKPDTEKP